MRILWRFLLTAVAAWLTVFVLPGIGVRDGLSDLYVAAFVFGAANAFIRPLARLSSHPLDLPLLTSAALVVNGTLMLITAVLVDSPKLTGSVSTQLLNGVAAVIIISGVSAGVSWLLPDPHE